METPGVENRVSSLSLGDNSNTSCLSISQNLASDILILIFDTLSRYPDELYAPLICSHVCTHWRETIINTPSLWIYVDTSRGAALTRLWLVNSKSSMVHIRLRDRPYGQCYDPSAFRPLYPGEDSVVKTALGIGAAERAIGWRSLEVALSSISKVSAVLEDFGQLSEPLVLDYFAITPTRQKVFIIDDGSRSAILTAQSPPPGNPIAARSLFQEVNVKPTILHIDTYPIAFSPVIFSSHLTVLEVFSGSEYDHLPDINSDWDKILSHTPQLRRLCVWSPYQQEVNTHSILGSIAVDLPELEHLELTGIYIILGSLFTKSPLPKLNYILLDYLGRSTDIPQLLVGIGLVSPALTQLYVGSMCFNPELLDSNRWANAFRSMGSLRTLTFAEVEWREAAIALKQLRGTQMHVTLKKIWDINIGELSQLLECCGDLLVIELIDCLEGGCARCVEYSRVCSSESGSSCK
ncbi:hypothetical protein FRC09_000307 [Ceratobasidium sp. 395]|nr:hypothetical protein FRC09_000307 [Ceratobasidium sp. 395]